MNERFNPNDSLVISRKTADIHGDITLSDLRITFAIFPDHSYELSVVDSVTGSSYSVLGMPSADKVYALLAALSIAIHRDGTPDYNLDYPAAETVQPADPLLRFIP